MWQNVVSFQNDIEPQSLLILWIFSDPFKLTSVFEPSAIFDKVTRLANIHKLIQLAILFNFVLHVFIKQC